MSFFRGKNIVGLFSLLVLTWMLAAAPPSVHSRIYTLDADFDEGTLVNVQFQRNYSGEYNLEFTFKNVFPMKYRLEWKASYRPSGVFSVFVNGTDLGAYDTYNLRQSVISVTGERFSPDEGFNTKDWWVVSITDFGDVSIRIEYLDSGIGSNNGLNIDYISLIPAIDE